MFLIEMARGRSRSRPSHRDQVSQILQLIWRGGADRETLRRRKRALLHDPSECRRLLQMMPQAERDRYGEAG